MKTILNRNIGLIILFLFLGCLTSHNLGAQNRDSLFNKLDMDADKIFEEFNRANKEKFRAFRDSIDAQFVRFMRANWESFQVFSAKKSPLTPDKPKDTPKAPETPVENVPEKIKNEPEPRDPEPELPNLPPRKKELPEPERDNLELPSTQRPNVMDAGFYDTPFQISVDRAYSYQLQKPYNNGIPDAWTQLAGALFFPQLYKELNIVADAMQLNDWGYLMLVKSIAERIYPNNINQQVIFTCFTLNKSGYQVKLGYNKDDIFLLLPSYQQVYEKPYLTVENVQFYIFTFNRALNKNLPINTYKGQYGNSQRFIDFNFKRPMRLSNKVASKRLSFEYNYQVHNIDVRYNPTIIKFYQDMPHVDFEVTLSSPLSASAFESIKRGLMPLLSGKSEKEQINIILRFVQKSFEYKTDQEQFGLEKYLYPEEVIHFPYSDCEDRSAMFSTLVRNILGLEVIGLIFPNHLATAVKFNDTIEGDFIEYNGAKFIICDPTYIGADAGMCMPRFKNAEVSLVLLD